MATLTNTQAKLALQRLEDRQGRYCDTDTVLSQIGKATVFGVSGGKVVVVRDTEGDPIGVILPCGGNRAVEVVLNFLDLYDVRRVRLITSGNDRGSVVVEHEVTDLYCDQLAESVWRASCWK